MITDVSRFWFIIAALYILLRVVDNSLSEFNYRRGMKASGQGRFFGYVTVLRSSNERIIGDRFGLKWENNIGAGKQSDIYLDDKTLDKNHAVLGIHQGEAFISPRGQSEVRVNETPVDKIGELYDGDMIRCGDVVLRFRLSGGDGIE